MRLNTKMRYGTRALLDLALRSGGAAVSLSEIAAAQQISDKYLEQLFAALRSAGIVQSQRGARGGYALARPAEQITLREIYDVFEGPGPLVPCLANPAVCHRQPQCVTQQVWAEMDAAAMHVLASTTLADLVARCREPSA